MLSARSTCLPILAVTLLLAAANPASANPNEPLRSELAELAKSVKDVLDEEKQSAVAIGDFTGPPRLDSQFGPGIQTTLADELTRLGVTINKRADLTLTGNYSDAEEKLTDEKQLILKIHARILSHNGDELVKLSQKLTPRRITDNTTIAKVTGVTLSLPPAGDKQSRNDKIREAIKEPKPFIKGSRVSAGPDANLAVEVVVRNGSKAEPRTPKLEDGQAHVSLKEDDIYELWLHNANSCEGAVTITIDGVDVFQFSKDRDPGTKKPKFSHFILAPKNATRIAGWHVTNDPTAKENILSFKITEYGKGAVSLINAPRGKVGVITITYALAATSKDGLPNDDGARSARDVETGFGPGQKQDIKEVKRVIGVVREVVSIRYSH